MPNARPLHICAQAFQASHDRSLSIVQGSATSDHDLVAAKAGWARSHLILADSLTADPATEDLSILLQVWAIKGFCKNIPLYVQVRSPALLRSAVAGTVKIRRLEGAVLKAPQA